MEDNINEIISNLWNTPEIEFNVAHFIEQNIRKSDSPLDTAEFFAEEILETYGWNILNGKMANDFVKNVNGYDDTFAEILE